MGPEANIGPEVHRDWISVNQLYGVWDDAHIVQYLGTCAGMSLNWIKKALQGDSKLLANFDAAMLDAIAAQYVKVVRRDNWTTGAWLEAYLEILQMRAAPFARGNGTTIDPTTDIGTYGLVFSGTPDGVNTVVHMIAFRRDDRFSSYYDPNFGQFSVNTSRFSNFKDSVNALIASYGWNNVSWDYKRFSLE